jgi:hypothetical protein
MAADVLTLVWVLGFLCGTLVIHVITYCPPSQPVEDERPSSIPTHRG